MFSSSSLNLSTFSVRDLSNFFWNFSIWVILASINASELNPSILGGISEGSSKRVLYIPFAPFNPLTPFSTSSFISALVGFSLFISSFIRENSFCKSGIASWNSFTFLGFPCKPSDIIFLCSGGISPSSLSTLSLALSYLDLLFLFLTVSVWILLTSLENASNNAGPAFSAVITPVLTAKSFKKSSNVSGLDSSWNT